MSKKVKTTLRPVRRRRNRYFGRRPTPIAPPNALELRAAAKALVQAAVHFSRASGLTWPEVEDDLKLRDANGMTPWRQAGNKHRTG